MVGMAELMMECKAHGIRLLAAGDGGLTIDAPRDAITPALVGRLREHKNELLALLRPAREAAAGPDTTAATPPTAVITTRALAAERICPCGSTHWCDVPIHGGQSIRRECGECRRFIDFPVWYRENASQ